MYKGNIEGKRLKELIHKRSIKYYQSNKKQCVIHNQYKRCEVFIKFGKPVWPPLSKRELQEFIAKTKLPRKYWKNKKLW